MKRLSILSVTVLALCCACGPGGEAPGPEEDALAPLKEALTFHAAFDDGPDAAFARGDRRIYTAPSYNEQDQRTPGIGNPDVEVAPEGGKVGGALKFNKKNTHAIFYSGEGNAAFSPQGWTGTISFWLSLDPAADLEPGFCDPIQVTDSAYNDSAIWVDFTRENPRQFRLGVFGELSAWNPENTPPNENPAFQHRLVAVEQPPFASGEWTHVVITHEGLGSGNGWAKLYLNGALQGTAEGISEPFEWDMAKAAIRIGVNYVGLFDELAVFNRVLSDEEIHTLHHGLAGGVAGLHP